MAKSVLPLVAALALCALAPAAATCRKRCPNGLVCAKVTLLDVLNLKVCLLPHACRDVSALGLGCNCHAGQKCAKPYTCHVPTLLSGLLPINNGVCCNKNQAADIPPGCPCGSGRVCRLGYKCSKQVLLGIGLVVLGSKICVAI